jgi:hypothetical protein
MAIISTSTGRWELLDPHRRLIAWCHPDDFDHRGRWHYVDPAGDRTTQPYRDDDVMQLIEELIDTVIICRAGSTGDAGAQLSVITSLTAELDARIPETIFEARNQDYTWAQIAARLDMAESTIRHRYSHYVACRKEMPLENFD